MTDLLFENNRTVRTEKVGMLHDIAANILRADDSRNQIYEQGGRKAFYFSADLDQRN